MSKLANARSKTKPMPASIEN